MTTKSSGFTLIELLVVVAILGIIAAIGISSYNGYVSGTKQKSVENAMMQMSLGQTEYYSNNGYYYPQKTSNNCSPNPMASQAPHQSNGKLFTPIMFISLIRRRNATASMLIFWLRTVLLVR